MAHIQSSLPINYFHQYFQYRQPIEIESCFSDGERKSLDDFHKSTILMNQHCPPLSLLSQMLQTPASNTHSPTTTVGDMLSDNGSSSTHSTPPMLPTPPPRRSCIQFAAPKPKHEAIEIHEAETLHQTRTVKFAGPDVQNTPRPALRCVTTSRQYETDHDGGDATPIAKKSLSFHCAFPREETPASRAVSDTFLHQSRDDSGPSLTHGRSIRFSQPNPKTGTGPHIVPAEKESDSSRVPSANTSSHNSPILLARPALATCKSTLDAMLRKESTGKVVEENLDDDYDEESVDQDTDEDDSGDNDEDVESYLALDADIDDGYLEDIESSDDDDDYDDDLFPIARRLPRDFTAEANHFETSSRISHRKSVDGAVPVFCAAPPSESDLPDTTDFAAGTLEEDQPACVAFDTAVKDRERARRITTPQDIDPTFPDSGSDDNSDGDYSKTCKGLGTSPAIPHKLYSPPAARRDLEIVRTKSLPSRRCLGGRKEAIQKPQRAVTIKQATEARATRRKEKREVRHNDHHGNGDNAAKEKRGRGFEKMKTIGLKVCDKSKNPANLACISI